MGFGVLDLVSGDQCTDEGAKKSLSLSCVYYGRIERS
jgi:hypothetical protein